MFKNFDEKFNLFIFVVILPFLLFFMSYYGFESSYTRYKISEETPTYLFTSVYSYRLVPNLLSVICTDFVGNVINNLNVPIKDFMIKNGTPFYHGLFFMNTIFFLLCSLLLEKILSLPKSTFKFSVNKRRLVHLLCIFLIVITQYTPTNCDMLALCCYLMGCLLTLRYLEFNTKIDYYSLLILIFISTLVRETSCLNIAFFAAIFFSFKDLRNRNYTFIIKVIPLILAFVIPYLALRKLIVIEETTFVEGIYILQNFSSPFNLSGFIFAIICFYFIYKQLILQANKDIFKKYLFFSLPYLMMITLVGLFWEVRLFLPLFLTEIIVASYRFKNTNQ